MTTYSPHFTIKELADPLTGKITLQPGFIDALEKLRLNYGHPMPVTSACRSAAHNKAVGGHPRSLHLMANPAHNTATCAVDVAWDDGTLLAKLQQEAGALGFSMGLASDFIHLDWRMHCTGLVIRNFHYLR